MIVIRNNTLRPLICESYSEAELDKLFQLLTRKGTFNFPTLANGLFSAIGTPSSSHYTGYTNVWVRDNVFIALAHYVNGLDDIALHNVRTLAEFFIRHRSRLENIIAGKVDFNDPMNRPHIRFDGRTLSELPERWAHAQNDALGYFVWLFCKIYREKQITPTSEEAHLLALFARYWERIKFWSDEDSGHWEEVRKIEASSIGVVLAALNELQALACNTREGSKEYKDGSFVLNSAFIDALIAKGRESLRIILPAECNQPGSTYRLYDAALLFLIFPMNVVDCSMSQQITGDVISQLSGDYGIKRYLGDSFWAPDYKVSLKPEERTVDFSENMAERDKLIPKGKEAQWCIFDSILSIIYGIRFTEGREHHFLSLQIFYFNRAVGQITQEDHELSGFRCPELYYLEDGVYMTNDIVPLLWAQGNLWMAFHFLKNSLRAINKSLSKAD
jgi:phosphorylase kinase alpha/beta subunit